jgi:Brp/Blh family beta-carotene 15,15'-monooxygenase
MNGLAVAGPLMAVLLGLTLTWLVPAGAGAIVLALVVACLVVPHGALDALSLRGPWQWLLYVVAFVLVAAGWWVAPVVSLGVFFGITMVHFAQGDAAFMAVGQRSILRVAARGVLPLSLPGVFHPAEYVAAITLVLESLQADTFVAGLVVPLSWLGTVVSLLAALWSMRRSHCRADGGALLGLLVLFAVAPPLLSIGLYLALWHGWRHGLRVSELRTGAATIRGVVDACRSSLPTIMVSVSGFLVMIGIMAASGAALPTVLGPTLALLASLTVPHVVVVTALDLRLADAGRST